MFTYLNSKFTNLPVPGKVLNGSEMNTKSFPTLRRVTKSFVSISGYPTPSVFLTRSVCLCSSAGKVWPLPLFLISVLALTSAVLGRSGLRSTVRGDLIVPGPRTEWGSRSFAVAGLKCWNKLPVGL